VIIPIYRIKSFFTPVSGWTGGNATEITSENSFTVSGGNTFKISVDGTASGTITLPAATYSSNSALASALQTAINADSNLSNAGKSVSVKWTGTKYEIVSNTGRQTYSITDTTIASVKNFDAEKGDDKFLKIVKNITSKGFVRSNYEEKLVDLSDVRINLKTKN